MPVAAVAGTKKVEAKLAEHTGKTSPLILFYDFHIKPLGNMTEHLDDDWR
ncbi:hypothetical protein [Litchfieldella xinjiangensis]|nr:hypothetical protein [Halomonas xinjiangensis]